MRIPDLFAYGFCLVEMLTPSNVEKAIELLGQEEYKQNLTASSSFIRDAQVLPQEKATCSRLLVLLAVQQRTETNIEEIPRVTSVANPVVVKTF